MPEIGAQSGPDSHCRRSTAHPPAKQLCQVMITHLSVPTHTTEAFADGNRTCAGLCWFGMYVCWISSSFYVLRGRHALKPQTAIATTAHMQACCMLTTLSTSACCGGPASHTHEQEWQTAVCLQRSASDTTHHSVCCWPEKPCTGLRGSLPKHDGNLITGQMHILP